MYITVNDVERFTGASAGDFRISGAPMSQAEWVAFVTDMHTSIVQMIHRYCRVTTFDPTAPNSLVTELHSGKGYSDYDTPTADYIETDWQYYLRDLYYPGGTINGTVYAPLVVTEDVNPKNLAPAWCTRLPRPAAAQAESDQLMFFASPTLTGTVQLIFNGSTIYSFTVTAGQSLSGVCSAIIANGAVTDSVGIVWTPTASSTGTGVVYTAGITGPVNSMVYCNVGSTNLQYYSNQLVQGANASGGDYEVVTTDELTEVFFYNRIPRKGYNNVKFVYTAGYDPASPQFADIKMVVLRCFKNLMLLKKKIQEPLTIRAHGARDFSTMFEPFNEEQILSDMEKIALDPYRRFPITGPMYD
jgi:hypothetical protein